ncbi:MAG: SOS response-associated peptidase [Deltaproteobacteria bacterium]|jgi:putative SOS response-associated peptidase YedK|nr:SOS response-associated peptidase [Deltaproteobacteria bacterium]
MCGRFTSYEEDGEESKKSKDSVSKLIDEASALYLESPNHGKLKTKGEVFPTDIVPILVNTSQNDKVKLKAEIMYWGYPGFPDYKKPGSKPRPLINTKGETALKLKTWKDSSLNRRCIVPTGGFYEWSHHDPKKKIKYLFKLPRHRGLFLGGIYKEFKDEEGLSFPHFSIVTVAANDSMIEIHDRMPLILLKDDFPSWLGESLDYQELFTRNSVALSKAAA